MTLKNLKSFFSASKTPKPTHLTRSDTDLQASHSIRTKCFSLTHTELASSRSSERAYSTRRTLEEPRMDRATPVPSPETTVHNEVCANPLRDPEQHPPTAGMVAASRQFAIRSKTTVSRASRCGTITALTTTENATFGLAMSKTTPLMSNEESDARAQIERCQISNPLTHVESTPSHREMVLLTITPDTVIDT